MIRSWEPSDREIIPMPPSEDSLHARDHQQIFNDIRRLEETVETGFKELVRVFERDCVERSSIQDKRTSALEHELYEEKRRVDEAVRGMRLMSRIVWLLGGAVALAITTAILKGIGLG